MSTLVSFCWLISMDSCELQYGVFFFKQKTAYEMRISDWSSDVCSSDLQRAPAAGRGLLVRRCAAFGARRRRRAGLGTLRPAGPFDGQIGRASCRERVCQYV